MIRILLVSHSLPPAGRALENVGGMQRSAIEMLEALRLHPGVELIPCVLRSAWSRRHWRVPLFLASALVRIARHAARGDVDVVLFSSIVTGALAIPLRPRLSHGGIPSAVIVHGLDVTLPLRPHQRLVRRIFRSVDVVLPVSRATAAECIARGLPTDRAIVVHPGVDVRRFTSPADRAAARRGLSAALGDRAWPLPDDAMLLCSVGRQVRRKGFAWFVDEVMSRLPQDVHFWLAGDGPEREHIRAAVARHRLEGRVRLLGGISEDALSLLYGGSDLFVMPNIRVPGDMEGFGLVMLEAGASGLPVLAARLDGITDVITEGTNGHLVSSGAAREFIAVIERFRRDRAALATLGARAARHTRAAFDWSVAVQRYVDVLRRLRTECPTTR